MIKFRKTAFYHVVPTQWWLKHEDLGALCGDVVTQVCECGGSLWDVVAQLWGCVGSLWGCGGSIVGMWWLTVGM